ncbi:MAG TPA: uroporphyrinogen-III synthase [Oculatellaceae cyanobacterium]
MRSSLTGIGIAVTRDERQAPDLSDRLKALGASVFEFPLLEIRQAANLADLDKALDALETYNWIVFASVNAVDYFLRRMAQLNIPTKRLQGRLLASVGSKTGEHLQKLNLEVNFVPKEFSGEQFAAEFCAMKNPHGLKILWPRTNVGKLTIKEKLEKKGATVDAIVVYETHLPVTATVKVHDFVELIRQKKIQVITLASGQAARNLHELLKTTDSLDCLQKPRSVVLAAIGNETSQVASELFACEVLTSKTATIPALVETIQEFFFAR